MRVKEYFQDKELACKCGCGTLPPERTIERLYALRLILGRPLIINSGARCPKHNAKVNGAAGSIHMPSIFRLGESVTWGGGAFDIAVKNNDEKELLVNTAHLCGFQGIGIGLHFVHIDDALRPKITKWQYNY
jgi:hypothetical protein